jgi:hypothetical protein
MATTRNLVSLQAVGQGYAGPVVAPRQAELEALATERERLEAAWLQTAAGLES